MMSYKTKLESKKAPCLLCRSLNTFLSFKKRNYSFYQCSECGFLFIPLQEREPILIENQYQENFYQQPKNPPHKLSLPGGYFDYHSRQEVIQKDADLRLSRIENFQRPGRILEVGCAFGFFLERARERGWQPFGYDISSYSIQKAKDLFYFPVADGDFKHFAKKFNNFFEVVVGWDLLAHMIDPIKQLKLMIEMLAPKGLLVLETAVKDSLVAKFLGKNWYFYHPPLHLNYFDKRSLRKLLEICNLKLIKWEYLPRYERIDEFLHQTSLNYNSEIFDFSKALRYLLKPWQKKLIKINFFTSLTLYIVKDNAK